MNQNGTANIIYPDTTFETQNWIWNFKLNDKDNNFKELITYLGIDVEEFKTLRAKVIELNGESILVNPDKSISMRYDGFFLYQYEYYFPSNMNKAPSEYKKLDEGIYSGLYDNGLYCGRPIIFET